MWAAIKSDLSEFVTGVAEEGTSVLQTTGDGSAPSSSTETPSTPGGANGDNTNENATTSTALIGEDGDVLDAGFDSSGVIASAADEVARRRNDPDTYTVPLDENDPDVQAFVDAFDIDSKTNDIAKLLEQHPDTLRVRFEELATEEISYAQFWQRYFYRCNEERAAADREREEQEASEARAQALAGSISTVRGFFGGAVKAVSQAVEGTGGAGSDPVPPSSPFLGTTDASGTGGALSFFGGRPPFVMNTAVDDDDDDDGDDDDDVNNSREIEVEEEVDEDEEEELGWDDDDDDDDDGADDDGDEEINFSGDSFEVNKLKDQLKVIEEERNQLQATVELQQKELKAVRTGEPLSSENSTIVKEMDGLKMKLFEKDSELGALKASLEDTHDETRNESLRKAKARIASLERDLEKALQGEVDAKAELEATKAELEATKTTAAETETALQEQVQELERKCAEMQEAQAVVTTPKKDEDHSSSTTSTGIKVEEEVDDEELIGTKNPKEDGEDDWGDDW